MSDIHEGKCHCGNIRFEVTANIDHVRSCNCSVCSMRGALIFRVSKSDLRLLTPKDNLTLYQWGTRTGEDYFCNICGILPFRKPSTLTSEEIKKGMQPFDGWAVNVRCLTGFDYSHLPIVNINRHEIPVK